MLERILVLLLLLGLALPVWAQGCPLCKTSVAAAGPEAAQALNLGIFVLLIPTLSIFLGILYWAFRHRG